MNQLPYYLGCPIFATDKWLGHFFREKTPRRKWLAEYASVHNTVEGNSVFYGLPTEKTVRKWVADVSDGFRFALKFPRIISHELQLRECERELNEFLKILSILQEGDCLGPSFLQLPPTFSPDEFSRLETFLRQLPGDFPWAVEVRHLRFYEDQNEAERLDGLLSELGINRVMFDSRPLFARSLVVADEEEQEARRRKPRLPFSVNVTADSPFLRLIACNDMGVNQKYIEEWAEITAGWIQQGRIPYVFLHAAGYTLAPDFCRAFHQALQKHLPELPNQNLWPVDQPKPGSNQLELF